MWGELSADFRDVGRPTMRRRFFDDLYGASFGDSGLDDLRAILLSYLTKLPRQITMVSVQ
jgi:hypothetical protein